MNSLSFIKNKPPSEATDPTDIDITPLMNIFIILVSFLISMAVFTHLAVLQFSLPPNVGVGLDKSDEEKPKLKITVIIDQSFYGITLGENMLDSISRVSTPADSAFSAFVKRLAARRTETELQDEIIIAPKDKIPFQDVVQVMDKCRQTGFEKLNLSSAADGEI